MSRPVQAISPGKRCFLLLSIFIGFLLLPHAAAQDSPLQRDIVVLIDQSRSVDEENRRSALKLVSELVGGAVTKESLGQWQFARLADAEGAEESANLEKLFANAGAGLPLAKENPRHLLAGLGNYSQTLELRSNLDPGLGSTGREGLATIIASSAELYPSRDNSTHVTLAKSILAEKLLNARSAGDYYLIVISDFHEDCFNRPISEYATPGAQTIAVGSGKLTLAAANAMVHEGQAPFNDGDRNTGTYTAADKAAISYFRQKVEQLQLGEFNYIGLALPGSGKLPVKLRIYAHSPKRSLTFGLPSYQWVFPAPAPVIKWSAEGLSPGSTLTLAIAGQTAEFKATGAHAEAEDFSQDLAKFFKAPLRHGEHRITLAVSAPRSPHGLTASATLDFVVPTIGFTGEAADSTAESPFEFGDRSEIYSEPFSGRIEPSAGVDSSIKLTLEAKNKTSESLSVQPNSKGIFEVRLKNFPPAILEGIKSGDTYHLVAALPDPGNILALDARPSAICYFRIPAIKLWPEGYSADADFQLKTDRIRFKSSHAGIPGYDWGEPTITRDGAPVPPAEYEVGPNGNTIKFTRDAPAGTYEVAMRIAHKNGSLQEETFALELPSRTPWMLIALGTMGILSLGLAGWYAFTRR